MPVATIFTRFLSALDAPHTREYSDAQFRGMTFKSLYGLSHALTEYKIPNRGIMVADKDEIVKIAPPFLAQTSGGIFVIVENIDPRAGIVEYDSRGEKEKVDLASFKKAWNGAALLAFPDENSREPDYPSHRVAEIVSASSRWLFWIAAIFLFAYFFINNGLWTRISTILLSLFNLAGLYLTFLLTQKSLNIHSAASDRVCGVLEHGGCDSIVKLKVSKLFGVFSWSEIGLGYFSVSLATLLMFPAAWPGLALCDICCLPYTVWSIWYQKFRAKHWCALCVGVQITLWLLFFCYLGGGFVGEILPLRSELAPLVAAYVFAVIGLRAVLSTLTGHSGDEENS